MAAKVNLDALVPREDFEIGTESSQRGLSKDTLSVNDLKKGEFFFSALRKPDFQRETNEWDSSKICDLIESFLDGDLIPALILWRHAGATFVIDGSHRISALAAWINDDYGDADISKEFYDGRIPEEQIEIAEQTRQLVRKRLGSFKDHQLALERPDKVAPEIVKRSKRIGALAVQLQWVEGDSKKAEASFFKINQKASPINPTELRILNARRKPNGIAARAIVRSGKGHKYWSTFSEASQEEIQKTAQEINELLFKPRFASPIKTLDLPIGGKTTSAQSLPLVLDFINIVNPSGLDKKTEVSDDIDGQASITYLKNCRKIARLINSNHTSSLGLHPIVYFYSRTGRHKIASFHAFTALIMEFEKRNWFKKFISVREKFEAMLVKSDYLTQQIVRKHRSAIASYEPLKEFYFLFLNKLLEGKGEEAILEEITKDPAHEYLNFNRAEYYETSSRDFSTDTKSATFINEAISTALKCGICGGYIHVNSISIDHRVRKQDGGKGNIENAQLTHPFCNSGIKN